MGVCLQHPQLPSEAFIQLPYQNKTITPNPYYKKPETQSPLVIQLYQSESESYPSNHELASDQEQITLKTISRFSTKYSVQTKPKTVFTPNSKQSLFAQKAKIRKISSFVLEEDKHSIPDDESLNQKTLMDVDLKYRHDAIISIQKIQENRSQKEIK